LWGRQEDSTRRYECQYVSDLQIISCFRGLVVCETLANFDGLRLNYDIFGIASTDMIKFLLHPRNLSDLAYGDFKQQTTDGKWAELSFYASGEQTMATTRGLMVKDAQCFKRIIDLFKVNDNQVTVELVNKQKVTMLGYINYLSTDSLRVHRHQREQVIPFSKSLNKLERVESEVTRNQVSGLWRNFDKDTIRRFECQFSSELNTLSCFRGLVRCETSEHLEGLTQNYEIYGLGTTDMINFHLYPRNFTQTKFLNYRVPTVSGKTVELSLLKSGMEGYGLVVRDAVCFQRIVDFLRVVSQPTMVNVDGSDAKVAILGYIVNTDLPIY